MSVNNDHTIREEIAERYRVAGATRRKLGDPRRARKRPRSQTRRVRKTTAVPVQRWAKFAAWGAFLSTVPSAVWRVLMIVGLIPGSEALRQFELGSDPTQGYIYVFVLSSIQVGAGFLTLGLIR